MQLFELRGLRVLKLKGAFCKSFPERPKTLEMSPFQARSAILKPHSGHFGCATSLTNINMYQHQPALMDGLIEQVLHNPSADLPQILELSN